VKKKLGRAECRRKALVARFVPNCSAAQRDERWRRLRLPFLGAWTPACRWAWWGNRSEAPAAANTSCTILTASLNHLYPLLCGDRLTPLVCLVKFPFRSNYQHSYWSFGSKCCVESACVVCQPDHCTRPSAISFCVSIEHSQDTGR
jgi:hypothetical protein